MIQTDFTRTNCCGIFYSDFDFLLYDLDVLKNYNSFGKLDTLRMILLRLVFELILGSEIIMLCDKD
jgi:hypothetical protein